MRILLADGRPRVRFALRTMLDRQAGLEVVAEATDFRNLLSLARVACPDLVLLDWELPGLPSGDVILALREACPDVQVIVLSGRPEVQAQAIVAGANLFVSKTESPDKLVAAIDECQC